MKKSAWCYALSLVLSYNLSAQPKTDCVQQLRPAADSVKSMAEKLIKSGFTAGDGYGEVWIRDLNTFLEVACQVNDKSTIRKHLLTFFRFQQSDGGILDGYIPIERSRGGGYSYYFSALSPEYAGHKNTVETDQETSLVQAIAKYIRHTGDKRILTDTVANGTVQAHLEEALQFLIDKRWNKEYGLIWGATTADWGDVQPEHDWGVVLDDSSHLTIDIYDNAMFLVAINDFLSIASPNAKQRSYWQGILRTNSKLNIRKHLWDSKKQKFKPHIYLNGSPFPASFDEDAIYYHGGTTVAIEAGLLSKEEVITAYKKNEGQCESSQCRHHRIDHLSGLSRRLFQE